MAAPKNHAKAGGRKKGVPNKTTQELKDFYAALLSANIDNITDALKKLYEDSSRDYLMAIDKISQKVVANKKDITSDGEQMKQTIVINEITKK